MTTRATPGIPIMSSRRSSSKGLFQLLGSKKFQYAGKQPEQWRVEADKRALETTGLTFRLKFLGMQVVNNSTDVKGCTQALRELDQSCTEGKYRVLLTLSPLRVHLVQYPWKLACDHGTKDISYCCSDSRNPRLFVYITKQRNTGNHICVCLKTFSSSEITGRRLVNAFSHAFSCHNSYKSVNSFCSQKAIDDTGQLEDINSCVNNFRFKGLPHYHTQLFTSNGSKVIKERKVPCAPSCNSITVTDTVTPPTKLVNTENAHATRVHEKHKNKSTPKKKDSQLAETSLQGACTVEGKYTRQEKGIPTVLPRLKPRGYPPPPPPSAMNERAQSQSRQPLQQSNVSSDLNTPLCTPTSMNTPKRQKPVASSSSHTLRSACYFSCSFGEFGAAFTVPLMVAFPILYQLSSP